MVSIMVLPSVASPANNNARLTLTGPNGTTGSEFNTLLTSAHIAAGTDNGSGSTVNVGYATDGFAKMETSPYHFGRFGTVGGSTFHLLSVFGGYWSGSTVSNTHSFFLDYNSTELYPAGQSGRAYGRSVRCLAR